MKKVFALLLSAILILSTGTMSATATESLNLNISSKDKCYDISQNLYGTFIEDISYSCDGGLVSNLVNNNSFEYEKDNVANWSFGGIKQSVEHSSPMNKNNTNYLKVSASGAGYIYNIGYPEYYKYKTYDMDSKKSSKADMGFVSGQKYMFTAYVKNVDFDGTFAVSIDSNSEKAVAVDISSYKNNWTEIKAELTAKETMDGGMKINIDGDGTFLLDFVSLVPESSHGYGTDEWKYTSLRTDLYDALSDLNPSFIRFPGGCLCEGTDVNNLYSWKNTIGPLEERKQSTNLWNDDENGRYYINTNSMGYSEYFTLCSELGAEPLPILNVGLTCQARNGYAENAEKHKSGKMTDEQWQKYLKSIALTPGTKEWKSYVQDILDLIEYANGDSKTTYWGAIRAANGHEEPFDLKYIGLGNENWGEVYFRNFDALYKEVKKAHPEITVISSSGTWLEGDDFDDAWKTINSKYADTIVDEHYYTSDGYLFDHNDRYDSYDRNGAKVFVGEYAAKSKGIGTLETKNNIWEAVEEAGYLTGIERNGDQVEMVSYAPTFAKVNSQCWDINMIWFNSNSVVLTPTYYAQMLFSNNVGSKYIKSTFENKKSYTDDKIYESVTNDEENEVLYVKLVNASGKKTNVNINLDGYKANLVSQQYLDENFKSACNEVDKNYVVPEEKTLETKGDSVSVEMGKYSVNVVRIAYGNNKGDNLYKLKETSAEKGKYVPLAIKIAVPASICGVILLCGVVTVIVKAIKKKRNK